MLIVLRWVHLVAAALWLGGLVFVIAVMRAAVREPGPAGELAPVLDRCARRLKTVLIASTAALSITGIASLALLNPHGFLYVLLLIVKILVSVGAIALLSYAAFIRPRPTRVVPAPDETPDDAQDTEAPEDTSARAEFFFRPKKQDSLVQWIIVAATLIAMLLGVIVTALGVRLSERDRQQNAPPPAESSSS